MRYEFFYLVGQNNEEKLDEIKKEAEQVLIDEGAVFEELEIITKRKLSYKIKHQIRGTYIAKRFEMPQTPSKDAEGNTVSRIENISRKLNLNSNILRFLIVKADELPELKEKEAPTNTKENSSEKTPEKKEVKSKKEDVVKKSSPKKDSKKDTENIDKQLEEILNI